MMTVGEALDAWLKSFQERMDSFVVTLQEVVHELQGTKLKLDTIAGKIALLPQAGPSVGTQEQVDELHALASEVNAKAEAIEQAIDKATQGGDTGP